MLYLITILCTVIGTGTATRHRSDTATCVVDHTDGINIDSLKFMSRVVEDLVSQLKAFNAATQETLDSKSLIMNEATIPGAKSGTLAELASRISSGVCFDTVLHLQRCALVAAGLKLPEEIDNIDIRLLQKGVIISQTDRQITSLDDVDKVPSCSFIEFYGNGQPAHSMIAYRNGDGDFIVAGTKNQFIGGDGSLQTFLLKDVITEASKVNPGQGFYRMGRNGVAQKFTIHYRPIQVPPSATIDFRVTTDFYKNLMEVQTDQTSKFAREMYEKMCNDITVNGGHSRPGFDRSAHLPRSASSSFGTDSTIDFVFDDDMSDVGTDEAPSDPVNEITKDIGQLRLRSNAIADVKRPFERRRLALSLKDRLLRAQTTENGRSQS